MTRHFPLGLEKLLQGIFESSCLFSFPPVSHPTASLIVCANFASIHFSLPPLLPSCLDIPLLYLCVYKLYYFYTENLPVTSYFIWNLMHPPYPGSWPVSCVSWPPSTPLTSSHTCLALPEHSGLPAVSLNNTR